jgi:hypothetical protein
MASEHDHTHGHSSRCGCCASIDRRDFMSTVGMSALAAQSGLFGLTSTLMADPPSADAKPRVRVVFLRPKVERYWMGWPGACYDIKAREAEFVKTMSDAAEKFGVKLEVDSEPLAEMPAVDALLAECRQSPPDGLIAVVGTLSPGYMTNGNPFHEYWPYADKLAAEKGDVPMIAFSHMGTSFTGHLQATRKAKRCFVAATQDQSWLATGIKMLRTIWDMKNTRLCIVNGAKTEDQRLDVIGTTLHSIPLARWTDELAKQETTDEVRALAEEWTKAAKRVVEPKPQDVINAARNYFVAKRIMAAEDCQGISLNCLDLVANRKIPCPPCMAWQRLNDEGGVGCCECDWTAAISLRLCSLLIGRPGFMQDPAPNTVNGTLMGAHCSSPRKLRGFDQPAEPLILRSHSESEIGVSPQVIWPLGEPVTVMKFLDGPGNLVVGTGRVVVNIDTPPCGGCRTSVELRMDNVDDPRDCKGFHQLFVLGKHDRLLRAYCQLAGIKVVSIG